jgi:AhpD family alkylhydroperoxidase
MNTTTLPSPSPFPEQLHRIKENMEILGEGAPATMEAFTALHRAAAQAGALDFKTKELLALAIAVSLRCDGCIAFHTHDALNAGATEEEILEALGVAIMMGGGPSVIYATHVVEALHQFEQTAR